MAARLRVNFPMLLLLCGVVFTADPKGSIDGPLKLCNFDKNYRMYNATDLLLCMNEQARNILFQRSTNPNRITDRAYQERRQSYPAYPFAPAYSPSSAAATPSNYFGNEILSQLLSGGFKLPNFSNLLDFSSFMRPNFKLFEALSSISQYDDLKCVPRILCEVASGSMPGSLSYRQGSSFENFGGNNIFSSNNALIGLLTAFDTSGTSPILSFGRAALLGYTNRGQPHMCYREYSRCPRDTDQLIAYLNNHNGGFFQLFNGNRGSYYPQQNYYGYRPQSAYAPQNSYGQQNGYRPQNYYKNSVGNEYRIIQQSQYQPNQIFSEADIEQGGSGFRFGNTNYYQQDNYKPDAQFGGSGSFKFVNTDKYNQESIHKPDGQFGGSGSFEFVNTDNYHQENINKPEFFSMNTRNDGESSSFVFPKDKRDDRYASNYYDKPINSLNDYQNYNFQNEQNYNLQNGPNSNFQNEQYYNFQNGPNSNFQNEQNYNLQNGPNSNFQNEKNYNLQNGPNSNFQNEQNYQNYNFRKESLRKDRKFFPTADDNYNDYPIISNQIDDNRRPRLESGDTDSNFVRFPRETEGKVESPFLFSNNNNKNQFRGYHSSKASEKVKFL